MRSIACESQSPDIVAFDFEIMTFISCKTSGQITSLVNLYICIGVYDEEIDVLVINIELRRVVVIQISFEVDGHTWEFCLIYNLHYVVEACAIVKFAATIDNEYRSTRIVFIRKTSYRKWVLALTLSIFDNIDISCKVNSKKLNTWYVWECASQGAKLQCDI